MNNAIESGAYDHNTLFGNNLLRIFTQYSGDVKCQASNFDFKIENKEFY